MEKTIKNIRVKNIRKFTDCTGIKLKKDIDDVIFGFEEDLLKNKVATKFVKKYEKYFTTTDKNLLREFYEKTGLVLMNIFKSPEESYYATMYGFLKNDSEAYGGYYNCVFNNHLTTHIEIDAPLELSDDMYYEHDYDKDEPWGFNNEEYAALSNNPELIWNDEYEHCFKVGPRKNLVGAFGEHFTIKNGGLYRDDKKIEENVETVFRLNDCTSMIIFKDLRVEYLEWHYDEHPENCEKYDKIVHATYFIALLKNECLKVCIIDENEPNTSNEIGFCNVKDVEFVKDLLNFKDTTGNLRIYTNKDKYIELPIFEFQPYVRDYCL